MEERRATNAGHAWVQLLPGVPFFNLNIFIVKLKELYMRKRDDGNLEHDITHVFRLFDSGLPVTQFVKSIVDEVNKVKANGMGGKIQILNIDGGMFGKKVLLIGKDYRK